MVLCVSCNTSYVPPQPRKSGARDGTPAAFADAAARLAAASLTQSVTEKKLAHCLQRRFDVIDDNKVAAGATLVKIARAQHRGGLGPQKSWRPFISAKKAPRSRTPFGVGEGFGTGRTMFDSKTAHLAWGNDLALFGSDGEASPGYDPKRTIHFLKQQNRTLLRRKIFSSGAPVPPPRVASTPPCPPRSKSYTHPAIIPPRRLRKVPPPGVGIPRRSMADFIEHVQDELEKNRKRVASNPFYSEDYEGVMRHYSTYSIIRHVMPQRPSEEEEFNEEDLSTFFTLSQKTGFSGAPDP